MTISESDALIVSWIISISIVWFLFEIVVRLIVWLQDFRHSRRVIKRIESLSQERLDELNNLLDDRGARVDAFFANAPGSDDDDLEEVVEFARREAAIRYDPSLAEILRKDK